MGLSEFSLTKTSSQQHHSGCLNASDTLYMMVDGVNPSLCVAKSKAGIYRVQDLVADLHMMTSLIHPTSVCVKRG